MREEEARGRFGRLCIVEHPLLASRLRRLRDRTTPRREFRRTLGEVASLLAAQMLGGPARPTDDADASCVVILRAGLGMLDGLLGWLPDATVGFVGLRRDPATKQPVEYLVRLPPDRGGRVFVVDPMIATGGSATHVLDVLNRRGIADGRIAFLGLVAAPEGMARLARAHPDVPVTLAALDTHLNDASEIVPGVGDVGNRLFGTED